MQMDPRPVPSDVVVVAVADMDDLHRGAAAFRDDAFEEARGSGFETSRPRDEPRTSAATPTAKPRFRNAAMQGRASG